LKIKLDENLPTALADRLRGMGHDVETVHEEAMEGERDERIWSFAQSEERFLITQDLDFSDTRKFAPGSHFGLLLVRLREPGRLALTISVGEAFASHNVSGWAGCFIVLTERKLRILRPGSTG
jgi:predicted nuclease of predicted toxin-antitoxin system